MKYAIHIVLSFLTATVLLPACEQEDVASLDSKTAVVEGYLYAGQVADSIRITQSFAYSRTDSTLITLDGLSVVLEDGSQSHPLSSAGNGYYRNPNLAIASGRTYRMAFTWQGETVSAETFVPAKKEAAISATEIEMSKISAGAPPVFGGGQFQPVEVSWNNSEGDYYYVVIRNLEDNPEYINDRFPAGGERHPFLFISRPQIMDFYAINPMRGLTQFGRHEVIVFRVNPEYAALYELTGGSSLSITQPPSNVKNGLGILTGVSSDTLRLNVKKI